MFSPWFFSIPMLFTSSDAAHLVTSPVEAPCDDRVGTCLLDKSCPDGAECVRGECFCLPGSCGVGSMGPMLGTCVPGPIPPTGPFQPNLDPSAWFLTDDEILRSRHGHPRGVQGNIAAFSRGNLVRLFAEGEKFMADLYDSIVAAGPGDRLHMASWTMGPYYKLRPELDLAGKANTSLGAVLAEAGNRNVEVLALIWRSLIPVEDFVQYDEIQAFVDSIATAAWATTGASRMEAYMDARCKAKLGTIHQKYFVLQRQGAPYPKAWIGGIDIAQGRWDVIGSNTSYPIATSPKEITRQNQSLKLRQTYSVEGPTPYLRQWTGGWHDTQLVIEGPAAVDIAATFAERWNQPGCDLTHLPRRQPPPQPIESPKPALAGSGEGTAAVQVLRTYGCSYARSSGCLSSFAPWGEVSHMHGLIKAIQTARHFIYIEEQYFFWEETTYKALRAALRDHVLHVILLVQYPQETPGSSTYLWRFWHTLVQEFPGRVHGFYRMGEVYIHSKTKLFDDVWVMSGSANLDYRSHTSDAETTAAVVDEGPRVKTPEGYMVSQWAREIRCRLFEDNTGVAAAEWDALTMDEAVERWHAVAESPNSRIGAFHFNYTAPSDANIPEYHAWSDNDEMRALLDPDDRCSGD